MLRFRSHESAFPFVLWRRGLKFLRQKHVPSPHQKALIIMQLWICSSSGPDCTRQDGRKDSNVTVSSINSNTRNNDECSRDSLYFYMWTSSSVCGIITSLHTVDCLICVFLLDKSWIRSLEGVKKYSCRKFSRSRIYLWDFLAINSNHSYLPLFQNSKGWERLQIVKDCFSS